MRGWFLTASLTGLLALECEEGQPKASRGNSKSLERNRDPHSGGYPVGPAEEAEAPPDETSRVVHFGSITLTAPEGWKRKPAQSEFVNAEFVLPRASGDEPDGRLHTPTALSRQLIYSWKVLSNEGLNN